MQAIVIYYAVRFGVVAALRERDATLRARAKRAAADPGKGDWLS